MRYWDVSINLRRCTDHDTWGGFVHVLTEPYDVTAGPLETSGHTVIGVLIEAECEAEARQTALDMVWAAALKIGVEPEPMTIHHLSELKNVTVDPLGWIVPIEGS